MKYLNSFKIEKIHTYTHAKIALCGFKKEDESETKIKS
jgi:hypothetical protein